MNKSKMYNFNPKYLGSTNLIIVILVIMNCVGCRGQVIQKIDTQTKNIDNSGHGNNIILNQYKDSEKDGLWREYHHNGQLKSEGNYSSGLKDGKHREWGDNGILLLEGVYSEGKANGLMKWFHEGGHLAAEGDMVDDIRVGPWIICDIQENGFCIDAFFKNGNRDGIWKIYHENASDKLWKEQTFKEDKMVSEKCWDENGKPIECK